MLEVVIAVLTYGIGTAIKQSARFAKFISWFPSLNKIKKLPHGEMDRYDDIKKAYGKKEVEKNVESDVDNSNSNKSTENLNQKDVKLELSRHPNWVEVEQIRPKLIAIKSHVLSIQSIRMGRNGQSGFTGCHSKIALDEYVSNNTGSNYELKNKDLNPSSGVYEANPVITSSTGEEFVKLNNRGQSSFFPDSWSESKVLDEVEYAITNNHGKLPTKPNGNEYFGYSRDGKVKIHFYLSSDGSIGSYFPDK